MTNPTQKNDTPQNSELLKAMQGALQTSNAKIAQLTNVFGIAQKVLEKENFKQASLTLASEIADALHCERASLGWVKGDYIRLKAISHTDHFEKKMQVVRDLEGIMEEAYEQDAAIIYPTPENSSIFSRSHAYYAVTYKVNSLVSVPIRDGGETIAILTCERSQVPFTDEDAEKIHLAASLSGSRLLELYRKSGWFGVRIARSVKKGLAKLVGFEHTWAKIFGILAIAFVLFATLYPLEYKVTAPAILRTDKIIYVTAPFDGYIESTGIKPGDVVHKGDVLLNLDQRELKLEEADLMAVEQDNLREIQKARAASQLSDMRIQQAKLAQTQAKLKIVRYKLSKSSLHASADSAIVVEGDMQKRIGAHVSQGETLFQIALIENIYVEADVSEQEIKNVALQAKGLIAVKSRPDYAYRFRTERINPTAIVKDQENVFPVRGEFEGETPSWFRPGMTGVAKIYAGKRTLWWILSHQALDYLRIKLWW